MDEARAAGMAEPEAMTLATCEGGMPSARVVLCRGIEVMGVRFFTNYDSRKGRELSANPRAALVFHWPVLKRQVRLEGRVERLTAAESDAYFASRPRGSQLAASVSPQSQPIASLEELRHAQEALGKRLEGQPVPRPAHWGGFRVVAERVELWTNGDDRMHERRVFVASPQGWSESRIGP
jgi:pyridoxamine 5'-phosphate oxidase